MPAESYSGDWNLARFIPSADVALETSLLLPEIETQLLLPPEYARQFSTIYRQQSPLFLFESSKPSTIIDFKGLVLRMAADGFELKRQISDYGELAFYIFKNTEIKSYIKSIHVTKSHVEVYIETVPSCRREGFGKTLIELAVCAAHSKNKSLIYSVDSENIPSLNLVKKAGLQQFTELSRFIKS